MMRTVALLALALLALSGVEGLAAAPQDKKKREGRWTRMDYGRFVSASITAPAPPSPNKLTRGNTANKGIAIKLGTEAAICFDTELLRVSAGWTGGFLKLLGTPYDGGHGNWPLIDGEQKFGTKPVPGWARNGDFSDPRPEPFGPLPSDRAKYRGLYLHGEAVALSYTVGSCDILESPGFEKRGEMPVFTRTFRVGPSAEPLTLLVCEGRETPVGIAGAPLEIWVFSELGGLILPRPF